MPVLTPEQCDKVLEEYKYFTVGMLICSFLFSSSSNLNYCCGQMNEWYGMRYTSFINEIIHKHTASYIPLYTVTFLHPKPRLFSLWTAYFHCELQNNTHRTWKKVHLFHLKNVNSYSVVVFLIKIMCCRVKPSIQGWRCCMSTIATRVVTLTTYWCML